MHICLVCHTEPDVWDGGFRSIDTILPQFLDMIEEVRDTVGGKPRVAWCLTSQVIKNRPEPFRNMPALGHEIGVHSHFPGTTGILEHDQELNAHNLNEFHVWFRNLCGQFADAGFPPPRTHASWMFAYRDHMTRFLENTGIHIDGSICYGGRHALSGGFLLADSRNRKSGKPYKLDENNHCGEGNSSVVEIPVSGGLGCYWKADLSGEFQFFSPIRSDQEMNRQYELFQDRLMALKTGEVDIFHIHFHLYEFLPPDGTGPERIDRAKGLLSLLAQDNRVNFSTPSKAVENWEKSKQTN